MRTIALALGLLASTSPAFAHSGATTRTIALEPAQDRLHVLVHLEVRGTKRIEALTLMADANHDGRLSDPERKVLENRLAIRALDGVRLLVDSSTVALDGLQAALKLEPAKPIALMVLGSTALPPNTRSLAVTTGAGAEPLKVMVRPGTRPVVRASRGRPAEGGLETDLKAADRVSWEIRAP